MAFFIILDIHDVIFYTETPEKDWAFANSFEFQTVKLVASSGIFWGASVRMNIKNCIVPANDDFVPMQTKFTVFNQ